MRKEIIKVKVSAPHLYRTGPHVCKPAGANSSPITAWIFGCTRKLRSISHFNLTFVSNIRQYH